MGARLGLGLIGIGRPWPRESSAVASPQQTHALFEAARRLDIAFLDTAPAYGFSEERLGMELAAASPEATPGRLISTKCGEFWSPERGSWTDHSTHAVSASVLRSFERLGRIDVLHVHKASAEVLADRPLLKLLESLADDFGIPHLAASVKDVEAGQAALDAGIFDHVQCPVNRGLPELADWVGDHSGEITVVANRPYGSGSLVNTPFDPRKLLEYVLDRIGDGVVLTGTTDPEHLHQTHAVFTAIVGSQGRP